VVSTERNEPLTTWQTPTASMCTETPKVLLAPVGKVTAKDHNKQPCDIYFLGCGVCTNRPTDHTQLWMCRPGQCPPQLQGGVAPARTPSSGNGRDYETYHEETFCDEGRMRTSDGPTRREHTYRDERTFRTETRPMRKGFAPPFAPGPFKSSTDSLHLEPTQKRAKYDVAQCGNEDVHDDSSSTVSMSTVSSIPIEPALLIDEQGLDLDQLVEKVKTELSSDYGDTTTLEAQKLEDGRIRRAVLRLQTPKPT